MQLTLDIDKAIQERDKGIEKAISSAEGKNPGWADRAYNMFKAWLSGWPVGYRFQIENFRVSAYARGLEKPPTDRAFTVVTKRGKKDNLIKSAGLKATSSKTAHSCFATEWEKI